MYLMSMLFRKEKNFYLANCILLSHCIYSVAGHYAEVINMPISVYCASKYAVTGMTATLRTEITNAKLDIKVTVCELLCIN